MELYPAVDVQGGRVARVPPGHPDEPLAVAHAFAAAGARWVHYVDLDRAYGRGDNRALARRFLAEAGLLVQIGGGLIAPDDISEMLDWGAARVVLGARAAADGALLQHLTARHDQRKLAVAIETKDGQLRPRGAAGPPLDLTPAQLARHAFDHQIRTVVYTDVSRDGSLAGPDVDGARTIATAGSEVIVSGGIGSLEDLTRVRAAGLAGAVVGRALHEGRFSLPDALACLAA